MVNEGFNTYDDLLAADREMLSNYTLGMQCMFLLGGVYLVIQDVMDAVTILTLYIAVRSDLWRCCHKRRGEYCAVCARRDSASGKVPRMCWRDT